MIGTFETTVFVSVEFVRRGSVEVLLLASPNFIYAGAVCLTKNCEFRERFIE